MKFLYKYGQATNWNLFSFSLEQVSGFELRDRTLTPGALFIKYLFEVDSLDPKPFRQPFLYSISFQSFKSYNVCHRWRNVVINYSTSFLRKTGITCGILTLRPDEDLFLDCPSWTFDKPIHKEVEGLLNTGAMQIVKKFSSNYIPIINKLHEHRKAANYTLTALLRKNVPIVYRTSVTQTTCLKILERFQKNRQSTDVIKLYRSVDSRNIEDAGRCCSRK